MPFCFKDWVNVSPLNCGLWRDMGMVLRSTTSMMSCIWSSSTNSSIGLVECPIVKMEGFFILFDHNLYIRTSDGALKALPLVPRSVADFYAEFMTALRTLGINVNLNTKPQQFKDPITFEEDGGHAAYDPVYVNRWWRILTRVGVVMEQYRSGFVGKKTCDALPLPRR